jgi:prepilin-type N-terminal cleavage/methylation domain-containing protein
VAAGLGSGRGKRSRRSRDTGTRGEPGYTLIEILIAVTLLGAVTVAMMGALFTVSSVSASQQATTIAESEARRLAEFMRAWPYASCGAGYATALAFARLNGNQDTPVNATIGSVKWWTGTPSLGGSLSGQWSQTDCDDAGKLQLVTIDVADGTGAGAHVTFIKRHP